MIYKLPRYKCNSIQVTTDAIVPKSECFKYYLANTSFSLMHHYLKFFFSATVLLPYYQLLTTLTTLTHSPNDIQWTLYFMFFQKHQEFSSKFGPVTQGSPCWEIGESTQQPKSYSFPPPEKIPSSRIPPPSFHPLPPKVSIPSIKALFIFVVIATV